jgi:hypothetical protein
VPLLVLLSLETGLELECCKTLTIDCLRNASGGTVEIAYTKLRAHGAEHKTIRVRDGASTTPGGLIRRIIAHSAKARAHHPSDCLWVYYQHGEITAGIRHPRRTIDAWTRGTPLSMMRASRFTLRLSQLRKTHKALVVSQDRRAHDPLCCRAYGRDRCTALRRCSFAEAAARADRRRRARGGGCWSQGTSAS